jgi:NAD(P)-dependent dehydrogenase (short-subunit alcohol dehydrogenase family)
VQGAAAAAVMHSHLHSAHERPADRPPTRHAQPKPKKLLHPPTLVSLQYGYRMSKTALNMAGKLLAEDLAAQHIPVGIVHPGPVSGGRHNGVQQGRRLAALSV